MNQVIDELRHLSLPLCLPASVCHAHDDVALKNERYMRWPFILVSRKRGRGRKKERERERESVKKEGKDI